MSLVRDIINRKWATESSKIRRAAANTVNVPLVLDAYEGNGQDRTLPFVHITLMCRKRLKSILGGTTLNLKNPVICRLEALGEQIVADCIVKRYQARADYKGAYTFKAMVKEVDERINKLVRDNLGRLQEEYNAEIKEM